MQPASKAGCGSDWRSDMVRVSCNARLEFRVLLDCQENDEAVAIVKRHMHAAALQAALEMRRDGIDTDLEVDYLVAYEDAPPESP